MIAAVVVLASLVATAVTLLSLFNDAVAALTGCDDLDILVVSQTVPFYIGFETRADIANTARRELRDVLASRGVHNELALGITIGTAERAARRLCRDWTRIFGTVVDSPECMSSFMGEDLPLGGRSYNDICSRNSAIAIATVFVRALTAQLPGPGQTYSRLSVATCQ